MRSVASLMSVGLICAISGCVSSGGGVGKTGIGILGIPPAEISQADIANYEAAVASIGCNLITEADYEPVEIQTGLTREQVVNLSQFEINAGKAAPIVGEVSSCKPEHVVQKMLRRLYQFQPENFAFTPANQKWAEAQVTKYPQGRQASAIIPLLWRAQEQEGWLTRPAIETVADMLGMPYIRALEVASFYFMFQLQPVGSIAHIQICGTTSCMICGAENLIEVCREKIAPTPHTLSEDGKFSWEEVECLGACTNAPMAQIGKDYYEDLTAESFAKLLDDLAAGNVPVPGPQNGRYAAEPASGLTSLKEFESGHAKYNASAQLAADIGETVKRIDGTEVPLLTPWIDKGAMHQPSEPPAKGKTKAPAAKDAKPAAKEAKPAKAEKATAASASKAKAADAKAADKKATNKGADKADTGAAKSAKTKADTTKANKSAQDAPAPKQSRPKSLKSARKGIADDLKLIKGVGPKLEKLLHSLGFFHFDQVAAWTGEEVAWVDENLEGFKGRVSRDEWVAQAKILAAGGDTEFSLKNKS